MAALISEASPVIRCTDPSRAQWSEFTDGKGSGLNYMFRRHYHMDGALLSTTVFSDCGCCIYILLYKIKYKSMVQWENLLVFTP